MSGPSTDSQPGVVIASCLGLVALVLGGGAVAGLVGLELPEPANSMVHSLLWVVLSVVATVLLWRGKISARLRRWWMLGVVLVLGVLMGVMPNAMGSFTHGIFGLLTSGLVFNDYLIGATIVTVVMVLSTRMVCGWACHLGALQELLFRLNRHRQDRRGVLRQVKLPFALTFTVRAVVFVVFIVVAISCAVDLSLPLDPHRLYRLTTMATLPAVITLALTLALSPFVYRPWCHLACPLGLLGWLMERVALLRVRVDRGACDDCRTCVAVCPSDAMAGILDGKRLRPDCWSCGACIDGCPADAVRFRPCWSPSGDDAASHTSS